MESAKKLSKRQRKRLEQIQQRKEKESRRSDLYKRLEEQKLSEEHQKLLRSSKTFAQKVSVCDSQDDQSPPQCLCMM
jgi:hypothetical protein